MSQADEMKDAVSGDKLSISMFCGLIDEATDIETGDDHSSIAFTFEDGSIIILKEDEVKGVTYEINNENAEPDEDDQD